jgi:serine/threonine-protein kinase SRPK3
MGAGLIDSNPDFQNTMSAMPGKPNFYNAENNNDDLEGVEDEEASEIAEAGKKKKKRNKRKKKKNKDNESNASVVRNNDDPTKPQQVNKFFSEDSIPKQKKKENEPDFTPLKQKLNDSFFEDRDSSEDEGMPDYKLGGYHPIHVGEILIDRYVIIQKLGWGHFSTVWLTKDLKYNSYVAIKVQKSAQHYLEAAYDEVDILHQVATNWRSKEWVESVAEYYKHDPELTASINKYGHSGETSHCVQLLNSFIHNGPNGKHFIMVFEILGVNFLELIKRYDYKGVPIPLVRKLARQCLIGLDYMHRMCRIIHTDFKPENVVIGLRDEEVAEIATTG